MSDTTRTSNGTGFYGQMKQKNDETNTQDGFGEHRDKKYPMYTIKYTAVFLLNKRVPLTVANVYYRKHLFHNDISSHLKFLLSNKRLDLSL